LVLEFSDSVVGYVSYGRNRVPALGYGGEIFELYLAPECQGCGFGRRMFDAARKDLAGHGLSNLVVWALADNERAVSFYRRLGGRVLRRARETFGGQQRERVAFGFG
jgi:ribosomal protein S18 acetylase RimI-like enzyme